MSVLAKASIGCGSRVGLGLVDVGDGWQQTGVRGSVLGCVAGAVRMPRVGNYQVECTACRKALRPLP